MTEAQHSAQTEKIGMGLVSSVETHRGANLQFTKRLSGFNGISTSRDGEVRKIEVKTMGRSDNWIAVNGFKAIDQLFSNPDYWLYFVLVPENIVVMTRALPFIGQQLSLSSDSYHSDIKAWCKQTKSLGAKTGLKFFPRMHVKFKTPLRKIIANGDYAAWDGALREVWQNNGGWQNLFTATNEDD